MIGGSTSTKWFFVYLIPGQIGVRKCCIFEERGNLSENGREPTTNSTHIWCRCQDLNLALAPHNNRCGSFM